MMSWNQIKSYAQLCNELATVVGSKISPSHLNLLDKLLTWMEDQQIPCPDSWDSDHDVTSVECVFLDYSDDRRNLAISVELPSNKPCRLKAVCTSTDTILDDQKLALYDQLPLLLRKHGFMGTEEAPRMAQNQQPRDPFEAIKLLDGWGNLQMVLHSSCHKGRLLFRAIHHGDLRMPDFTGVPEESEGPQRLYLRWDLEDGKQLHCVLDHEAQYALGVSGQQVSYKRLPSDSWSTKLLGMLPPKPKKQIR
jgi:hypothetical protein